MALEHDTHPGDEPTRRLHLDAPVMVACVVAALAAIGGIVMAAKHGYRFVVLLLDRGQITARNAELFAACAWLAGAIGLSLGAALIIRLMYRINGTAAAPSDVADGETERPTDGAGRRR